MQSFDLLPAPIRRQLQEMTIDVQNLPIELLGAISGGWAPPVPQIVADLKRLDAQLRAQFPLALGSARSDGGSKPGNSNS